MTRRFAVLSVVGVTLSGLVFVASCGGGSGSSYNSPTSPSATTTPAASSPSTPAADVTITIVGMNDALSFSPNPANVRVGQTVAWRNADTTDHTATANGGAFDTGGVGRGATSRAITMGAAGTFGYHCTIHPTMIGTLNVTP